MLQNHKGANLASTLLLVVVIGLAALSGCGSGDYWATGRFYNEINDGNVDGEMTRVVVFQRKNFKGPPPYTISANGAPIGVLKTGGFLTRNLTPGRYRVGALEGSHTSLSDDYMNDIPPHLQSTEIDLVLDLIKGQITYIALERAGRKVKILVICAEDEDVIYICEASKGAPKLEVLSKESALPILNQRKNSDGRQ